MCASVRACVNLLVKRSTIFVLKALKLASLSNPPLFTHCKTQPNPNLNRNSKFRTKTKQLYPCSSDAWSKMCFTSSIGSPRRLTRFSSCSNYFKQQILEIKCPNGPNGPKQKQKQKQKKYLTKVGASTMRPKRAALASIFAGTAFASTTGPFANEIALNPGIGALAQTRSLRTASISFKRLSNKRRYAKRPSKYYLKKINAIKHNKHKHKQTQTQTQTKKKKMVQTFSATERGCGSRSNFVSMSLAIMFIWRCIWP